MNVPFSSGWLRRIFALLCAAAFLVAPSLRAEIVAGPVKNPANGHLYCLLSPNNWTGSEAEAVSLGGHLVTINDAAENHFVYTNFIAYGGTQRPLWLGLYQEPNEGAWKWASGEASAYLNWITGEPNNNTKYGPQNWAMWWPPVVNGLASPYAAEKWNDYWNFNEVVDAALLPLNLKIYGVAEIVPPPAGAAPIVTLPPQNQTFMEGAFASLQAFAISSDDLSYQWFKDGAPIPDATNSVLILSGGSAPLARWSFDTDARDSAGNLFGGLFGGATLANGRLVLNGNGQYMQTPPLASDVREKTLEAWVSVGAIDGIHRDVLSIQTLAGDWQANEFDGIVLGEGEPGHWRAGSDYAHRTISFGGPVETAASGTLVHVAAVYDGDNRIAFYRNGVPYGTNYVPAGTLSQIRTYGAGKSAVSLGLRNVGTPNAAGAFLGEIDEARLYDRALSPDEIARSFAAGPNRLANGSKRAVALSDAGTYSVTIKTSAGATANLSAQVAVIPVQTVYQNTFASAPGAEWTNAKTSVAPTDLRGYLGDFSGQTVGLNLTGVPAHTAAIIDFDLFVLRSWDGSSSSNGPDFWELRGKDGTVLLRTTFNNHRPAFGTAAADIYMSGQVFPGGFTAGPGLPVFPTFTGAAETNTLGYSYTFSSGTFPADTVYHIQAAIPHSGATLGFVFVGVAIQGLSDESWGLDNVRVRVVNAPAGTFDLAAPVFVANEDGKTAAVQVNRIGGSAGAATVSYRTSDGEALSGADYLATSGLLSFADGETSKTISIPLVDDAVPEALESFNVTLSNPGGGAALARSSAQVMIVDNDGFLEFVQPNAVVAEIDDGLTVNLRWTGATNQTVGVRLSTADGTAKAGSDYTAYNGVIVFNPGETSKSVFVNIGDDGVKEEEESFSMRLSQAPLGAMLGDASRATATIMDNDEIGKPGRGANVQVEDLRVQPDDKILLGGGFNQINGAGRVALARLNPDGSADNFGVGNGGNNWIETVARQDDDKVLVGGFFGTIGGVARARIARLTAAGVLDTSFDPGSGANNTVYKILVQPDGKVLIAGAFTSVGGVARNRIARLNANGSLDTTFDPGTGADSTIYGMGLQTDGKIIVSGPFGTFNGAARLRFARLNADGSVDNTFNVGSGANGRANVILVQADGKSLMGGLFTTYNGATRNRVMRLNTNGSVDATFNAGAGPNSTVWDMAFQADGKIIVVGEWTTWNGNNSGGIVRLNPNGTLDTTFAVGTGANAYVGAVGLLSDGRIVIGGNFSLVNGFHRERIAFLNPDGGLDAEPVQWTEWKTAEGGNGHFYARTSRAESWTQAEAEAVAQGGHLAGVNSAAEQAFLTDTFLRGLDLLRPFWIGFSDAATEGNFIWSSGEPANYTAWHELEPNNKNNEDYTVINWGFSYESGANPEKLGLWNDITVDGSFGFSPAAGPYFGIMEIDPAAKIPVISRGLAGKTVPEGAAVEFVVEVTGEGPFSYEWRRHGTPIPNATEPTLKFAAATLADADDYSVRVSNFFGSATSGPAPLRVFSAPRFDPSQFAYSAAAGVSLKLAVPVGVRVVVEMSADLKSWQSVSDTTATDLALVVNDALAAGAPARFYRLKYILP